VRTILYTDKTVAQCMSAMTERLNTRGSKNLEGWVEKNGNFEISIATPLIGKLNRRTHLHGKVERQSGLTTVTLNVASGTDLSGQIIIFIVVAIISVILLASGALVPALAIIFAGIALYIPLAGDNKNSPMLVSEVQRTLKATSKPPKKDKPQETRAAPLSANKNIPRPAPKPTTPPVRKPGEF
jgi:hypothetical protein